MRNMLKTGLTVMFAVAGLSAGAQSLTLGVTPRLSEQALEQARNSLGKKAESVKPYWNADALSAIQTGAAMPNARVLKRDVAEGEKPGTFYTVNDGYYNLVPGYGISSDGQGNVQYAEHGVLGYIDRDLFFINRTPEADSFVWNFYGNTYDDDTISVHPFFSTDSYMDTPVLKATLAGVDSTYQMGAYVDTDGNEVSGMVALSGGAFVYNVDVQATPFVDTYYESISGDWSSMIFGNETGARMAYIEMFDAPYGGSVALVSTVFYVVTPTGTDLSEKNFSVSWVAKQKETGEWKEVSKLSAPAEYLPDASGNGLRVWLVEARPEDVVLAADSFYVMIEGPQNTAGWAMLHYYRSITQVDEDGVPVAPVDPFIEKNTAYFVYMDGELAGQMGQYSGPVENSAGEIIGYVRRNASLDIRQYVITPYLVLADDDAEMAFNETGKIDISINGETLNYLLVDWAGSAEDGVSITATVSESTDGDWLTISRPAAAEGLNRSYYFTFSVQASYLDFDMDGRRATVTLTDSKGFSRDIVVYQGDRNAADNALVVEKVNAAGEVKAVCDGADFLLTYPTDYRTLGVYDISGKLLERRTLSPSGSDRVSASALRGGIYLLRFTGKDAQTVKVLK